jgi:hypothetical protein
MDAMEKTCRIEKRNLRQRKCGEIFTPDFFAAKFFPKKKLPPLKFFKKIFL